MSDPAWWQTLAERANRPPLRLRQALRIGAAVIGSIEPGLTAQLAAAGLLGTDATISGDDDGADAALARIAHWLHDTGHTPRWRDELLAVTDENGSEHARIERSAVRPLGIATRAVHLIAFTPQGEVWVQQRALDKATDPGLWDTLMGGLVAAGESDADALERETWEEAGLRLHDLSALRRSDGLTVRRPVREGYMVEHIEVYEAVVPEGLVPVNRDGEVERFERVALAPLRQRLEADAFSGEAALILAASLGRRDAL